MARHCSGTVDPPPRTYSRDVTDDNNYMNAVDRNDQYLAESNVHAVCQVVEDSVLLPA